MINPTTAARDGTASRFTIFLPGLPQGSRSGKPWVGGCNRFAIEP